MHATSNIYGKNIANNLDIVVILAKMPLLAKSCHLSPNSEKALRLIIVTILVNLSSLCFVVVRVHRDSHTIVQQKWKAVTQMFSARSKSLSFGVEFLQLNSRYIENIEATIRAMGQICAFCSKQLIGC